MAWGLRRDEQTGGLVSPWALSKARWTYYSDFKRDGKTASVLATMREEEQPYPCPVPCTPLPLPALT